MPSDAVLRRKAQKKLKHRKYSRCEECGGFCDSGIEEFYAYDRATKKPTLHKCPPGMVVKHCEECGHIQELRLDWWRNWQTHTAAPQGGCGKG